MTAGNQIVDRCDCEIIHEEPVRAARAAALPDETVVELAEVFKVFGDPTRVRLLWALETAEMCVCDLAALLGMTQSAVSHQLRILRQARLVRARRDGKIIYYSPDDEHVRQIFDQSLIHVNEQNRERA